MLTPSFVLTQDADFLRLLIKARYAKVTDVETFVDGNDFKFYAKPYFLRYSFDKFIVHLKFHRKGRVILWVMIPKKKGIVSQHFQQLQCFLPSEFLWSLTFGMITKGIPFTSL